MDSLVKHPVARCKGVDDIRSSGRNLIVDETRRRNLEVPAFGREPLDIHGEDIAHICMERLRNVGVRGLSHLCARKDGIAIFDMD